jgi:hypothetical protein
MYMTAPKLEPGEQPDTDIREIQFKKSNYGRPAASMVLRYKNGLFLPEAGMSTLDRIAREAKADDVFLDTLSAFTAAGRNCSHLATAPSYAPTAFAKEAEAKKHHFRKSDLEAAMSRLFENGKIHVEQYGRPSRPYSRLAIK